MIQKLLYTLVLLGFFNTLFAEKITHYEINVTVEQSGELSIVENIRYDFEGIQRHGIFRDIPFSIKNAGVIKDLGLYNFSVDMDGHPVNWNKSTEKSAKAGDIIRLQIGSASSYVSGVREYKIYYRVKKGVLPAAQNRKEDAIRWNIVGTGWKIPIQNVQAHFFLPSSLSEGNSTLSTFTGAYGSKNSSAHTQWLTHEHLQVTVANLAPYEGATVELAYAQNTLAQNGLDNVKVSMSQRLFANWHWGALFGFLLYFFNMLKKHSGFKDNRAIAVQYEPPKGLSVLQSGLILDKHSDNEDFSAAVLELGQLGYLELNYQSKNTSPLLKKIEKNTKGLTANQKYFLDKILFKDKNTFMLSSGSEDVSQTLREGFAHINAKLYQWSVFDGYMRDNPQQLRKSFLSKSLLFLLPVILFTAYSIYNDIGADALFILIFPIAFGGAGLSMMLGTKNVGAKFMGFIFAAGGMMPLYMFDREGKISIEELLIGPVGVIIVILVLMTLVYKRIGNFTQKGAEAQKHLLGLKAFVKRVKEDEIKRRLALDPEYLEKMLPYAVLFNETDHWIDLFKLMNVQSPTWYHGNMHNISHFSSAVSSASTLPSSSGSGGGGFSGGGGSSGGGGGGGGGGSW